VTQATPQAQANDIAVEGSKSASSSANVAVDRKHRRVPAALLVVLGGGLALRLWGVGQGLPYLYNNDEAADFLPRAVHMFGGSLNPHYFTNPPALTYFLHVVFALWFGSKTPHLYARDPTDVVIVARVSVALLGTLAIWLLYLTGRRLFGRTVGLLAAALEAVAFLPVFYAHFALNDAPLLAPVTLSLLGSAGIMWRGLRRDYVVAGVGLGLGVATKYTCGIVALPLAIAVLARPGRSRARAALGVAVAGGCAALAFLVADPYALLAFSEVRDGLAHQAAASSVPKLGAPGDSSFGYYLWTLTWGLGWAPALAALGGVVTTWRRDRRAWWLLVPAGIVFLVFMNLYARHFGRWLLPIFPIICLLAAHAGGELVRLGGRHGRRWKLSAAAVTATALCVQGLVYSLHSDVVLSRPYTSALARAWMVAHIPAGARVVVEPVAPGSWPRSYPSASGSSGPHWRSYRPPISDRAITAANFVEDYELTLSPRLVSRYEHAGACWVVTGSTQAGRAYADPAAAPAAPRYYAALGRRGRLVYRVSPMRGGRAPGSLNFDWSFDYYPLDYRRPGPEVRVYRLDAGRCRAPK
jgi:4-amino-4-deoxy-L-arabinose transferase-like glycosyltransferase